MRAHATLYILTTVQETAAALEFVRQLIEDFGPDQLHVTIVDVERCPEIAASDNVICVPCLVITTAESREYFVDDLSSQESSIKRCITHVTGC